MSDADPSPLPPSARRSPGNFVKPLILIGMLVVLMVGFRQLGDQERVFSFLVGQESAARQLQSDSPLLVYGIAFAVYVCVTGLSLPGATALTLTYGWFFGFWPALLLVSFSSTAGATVAFLLSRYLFREAVQRRFGQRLQGFNDALAREGAFYLFTLRLIVGVPFFVINIVMGLTPLRAWTFSWVSQIGMLPGTAIYTYAGSSVPTLQELAEQGVGGVLNWQIVVAFALLGFFPIIAKKVIGRLSAPSAETGGESRGAVAGSISPSTDAHSSMNSG